MPFRGRDDVCRRNGFLSNQPYACSCAYKLNSWLLLSALLFDDPDSVPEDASDMVDFVPEEGALEGLANQVWSRPFPLASTPPSRMLNQDSLPASFRSSAVSLLTWMRSGTPFDSIRAATIDRTNQASTACKSHESIGWKTITKRIKKAYLCSSCLQKAGIETCPLSRRHR